MAGRDAAGGGDRGAPAEKVNQHPFSLTNELQTPLWNVTVGGETYRYKFYAGDKVKWAHIKSPTDWQGIGIWSASGRTVTIRWDSGSEETWPVPKPRAPFHGSLRSSKGKQDTKVDFFRPG